MTLRRVMRSYEHGLFAPVLPNVWVPNAGSFCERCAAHYPRSTCFYDQDKGSPAAGPRCETCDHVVRIEQMVEERRTSVSILFKCHGAEELHTYDLGTETWKENATNPGDEYEYVRRVRMADRYFVPSEQGEATVVGVK